MNELQERISKRLKLLKQQRERLIEEANRQVAMLNGAIAELEQLLTPPAGETQTAQSVDVVAAKDVDA